MMPAIIVKDYNWRQTNDVVIISMSLVGHPKKVDLFAIDNYMKASYPPFILELFLWGAIIEEESECTIGDRVAIFTLKKEKPGISWPCLAIDDLDRDKKRAHRSRALELARLSGEKRAKARIEKRQALEKQAVRAQIELDTATLNRIEAMRDSHRKEAMREFDVWRSRAEKPILGNVSGELQDNRRAYRAPLKWFKDEDRDVTTQPCEVPVGTTKIPTKNDEKIENNLRDKVINDENCAIKDNLVDDEAIKDVPERLLSARKYRDSINVVTLDNSSSDSPHSDSESETSELSVSKKTNSKGMLEISERKSRESAKRGRELVQRVLNGKSGYFGRGGREIFNAPHVPTPRPRRCGTIDVKFSERHFPTPARESHRLEEQEWLEKQAEARRKSGFVTEDLRDEEQDPQWLKDKGDELFKAGNYLGAISAYTRGIELSDKMSSLYVNRSAVHYAAGNYTRCAEDCSTALELMVPKCEGNRDSRARCHARFGAALCKLSAPQHGIPELEAALKLAPEDDTIKRDLQEAKRYFEVKD